MSANVQLDELKNMIVCGEDSTHQFKEDIRSPDGLAAEMVAFSNAQGGMILIGVTDNGELSGLSQQEVGRINQLISNVASDHVRSLIAVRTENIALDSTHKIVIVLNIPEGIDKPYFDNKGVIWLKNGADKRRVNSKEELRRLFQGVDLIHADEIPVNAGLERLDDIRFRKFLQAKFDQPVPRSHTELLQLLVNMNLAMSDGRLNLAGLLLFAEKPERIKPTFIIKAVNFPGTDLVATEYVDSEDFIGPFDAVFQGVFTFVMRNLRKEQKGQSVNSLGIPEVPAVVFEELLVNALVHRDYFISASIRLFMFTDRIEIISPGHLPNHLTVAKIRTGNSIIRNPILASYVAKGLLPYRGLGSGIRRALEHWPDISFTDDREGCTFKVSIKRKCE